MGADQVWSVSPFVAGFLTCLGICGAIGTLLWRQMTFERAEHRTAENSAIAALNKVGRALDGLRRSVDAAAAKSRSKRRRRRP